MKDPAELYATPEALLSDPQRSRADKIELLERWRFDETRRAVAAAEGMPGGEPDLLQRIEAALRTLQGES